MNTLWNILSDNRFGFVTIPNYQRDYAQGRETNKSKAEDFVSDLYNSLSRKEDLSLGLIYGSVRDCQLILVDGQQRITLLWLLHAYLGKCARKEITPLKKFFYNTRPAAERFCKFLIDFELGKDEKISSNVLKNNIHFQYEWLNDPTVSGMLIVLDLINKTFQDSFVDFFELLTNNESPVHFDFLPIDNITNEKIYMAMNARGLELTEFEIFKSNLFKIIDNNNIERKIDTDYTNLLWKLLKNKKNKKDSEEEKLIGVVLLNYIKEFARSHAFKELEKDNDFFEKTMTAQQKEWLNWFKQESFLKNFEHRTDAFEKYARELPELSIAEWLIAPEYKDRARLYALLDFLVKIPDNTEWKEIFAKWWHIVENIVKHTDINAENYKIVLELIDNISNEISFTFSFNFYKQISECNIKSQNTQWLQEKRKAYLIDQGKTTPKDIYKAEQNPVFNGNLFFLLGFEAMQDDIFDNSLFKQYSEISDFIFDINNISTTLLVRATLTYEMEYTEPISFHRNEINKWLNGYASTYKPVKQWLNLLRNLFIDLCDSSDIKAFLRKRITDYPEQYDKLWLYHLIHWEQDGKSLFDYSETKKIQTYDDSGKIYLYNKTRWTESNILLSNYRNEIVSMLLLEPYCACYYGDWGNINKTFFRGWDIWLYRKVHDMEFAYSIDRDYIRIGIWKTDDNVQKFQNMEFEDNEKSNGWICRKKYEYNNTITDKNQIKSFLENIEDDIFNVENANSLICKILNKQAFLSSTPHTVF
jgi:hypothetical protein